jgi:aspartyl-tRNA(Asn)/glutamyl-tRNA(Gln) amidotransferase subunit B
MNSFRAVERAVDYEIARQAAALDAGEALFQETRGWDDGRQVTYVMRSKEESHDYRYFPEPDLPPLRTDRAWLEEIRTRQPTLPGARRAQLQDQLGLSPYDATVIVADLRATRLFDLLISAGVPAKPAANWVTGEYLRLVRKHPANAVLLDVDRA